MKKISILGSTGSIGTQTLDVVDKFPERFEVVGLSAYSNLDKILEQIEKFKPEKVCLYKQEVAEELSRKTNVEVLSGMEGLLEVSSLGNMDMLVNALSGSIGLKPTLEAIRAKKEVALANKETLVTGGELVMSEAEKYGVEIIPIDSEHSAIYQCLNGENDKEVKRIILTASGGPFRGRSKEELRGVSKEEALDHPNWDMGGKITIDSATLMNKGLELIEAHHLFQVPIERISPLVHPQSIIHSMVEFVDNSIIAQLGMHDMRIPIQYALTYPKRLDNSKLPTLSFEEYSSLTFEKPDLEAFPNLRYAMQAAKEGGIKPAVLNAANEVTVHAFLNGKIKFLDIPRINKEVMDKISNIKNPKFEDILKADEKARKEAGKLVSH